MLLPPKAGIAEGVDWAAVDVAEGCWKVDGGGWAGREG